MPEQHTTPCRDCPWRRNAAAGWLGKLTPAKWLQCAHGESNVECHVNLGNQCAGLAIYRRNVCKKPQDPAILVLPADRETVFSSPMQFNEYHGGKELQSITAPED